MNLVVLDQGIDASTAADRLTALVEPGKDTVEDVDDARTEDPTDVLVRVTTTAICGSDLHMYEGRTSAKAGLVLGHENMGIVEEVGPGVASIKVGQRVSLPFNVAGPVGLMTAYSSLILGASKVFVVDRHDSRLKLAEQIGAIGVNFSDTDPVEAIRDQTNGDGTDKGIDAVGYQATGSGNTEEPAVVLNQLIQTVRATGMIGVVGLYLPGDPGASTEEAGRGELLVQIDKREDGYSKVVLKPGMSPTA